MDVGAGAAIDKKDVPGLLWVPGGSALNEMRK
jgi:hypothetical protein